MPEPDTAGERAPANSALANAVLGDWGAAMARFFATVERRMRDGGLTVVQVRDALEFGCGEGIACAWLEYMGVPPEGSIAAFFDRPPSGDPDDGQANRGIEAR